MKKLLRRISRRRNSKRKSPKRRSKRISRRNSRRKRVSKRMSKRINRRRISRRVCRRRVSRRNSKRNSRRRMSRRRNFPKRNSRISPKRRSRSRRRISKRRVNRRISRRISRRRRISPKSSPSDYINTFFKKIYIINLKGKTERFKKVTEQFNKNNIKYTRFSAVDGRCKSPKRCENKRLALMKKYNTRINKKAMLPMVSLVLGTLEIYKRVIKNNMSHALIFEDDAVFDPKFSSNLVEGLESLKNIDWDILYLGCGNLCGKRGVSITKTKRNSILTPYNEIFDNMKFYVQNKDDLRFPCKRCKIVKKLITIPINPGGTWSYAVSLKGAKKLYSLISKNVNRHIDQLLGKFIKENKIKAYAFDPPIVWHEEGACRSDSDIPWEW